MRSFHAFRKQFTNLNFRIINPVRFKHGVDEIAFSFK